VGLTDPEIAALVTSVVALITAVAGWVRGQTRHTETRRRLLDLELGRDPRDEVL
jgi:hypothetical protein